MGVSTTANRQVYTGDGSTTAFAFPLYFFNTTDLMVFVYDTIAGGVTTQILGTNYTVSGSANYQGIYPSGGTVTFTTYTPLSTDIVVIDRNPPEVQDFSLLDNGIIPSAALIQQFDYLTLLVQRLQDQMSRAITIPDGVGATFNAQLPSTVALQPGALVQVADSGTGFVLANNANLPGWQQVTIPYSSFSTASTAYEIPLFTLPPATLLTGVYIKHSQEFSGGTISDIYLQVGTSGNQSQFISDFDVSSTPNDQQFDGIVANYIASWINSTQIYIGAIATGGNLNTLTSGQVTVYYQTQFL